ncbi:MAG: ABC transporter ATP-binding protein, partial [Candidatus Rokubacteria bacterium]|nr:ABC transporter ATP-binding protein [Candidatus Rokubacteria bacterium]
NLREEMRFEIRRLHEEFAITTLYVTHDQAEAMVISDRVAVLHRGRVAQVGAPADLFERPQSRFVAEFIGKTNLLDAVAAEPGAVARGALRLRVAATNLQPGAAVALSIRPHEIVLERGRDGDNTTTGVVERAAYLGDAVDYQIRLDGTDVTLRVTTAPPLARRPGERVTLAIPPAACVPLPDVG